VTTPSSWLPLGETATEGEVTEDGVVTEGVVTEADDRVD
jgi:hypothetical protein